MEMIHRCALLDSERKGLQNECQRVTKSVMAHRLLFQPSHHSHPLLRCSLLKSQGLVASTPLCFTHDFLLPIVPSPFSRIANCYSSFQIRLKDHCLCEVLPDFSHILSFKQFTWSLSLCPEHPSHISCIRRNTLHL
jgi:hypothetical protein